MRITIFRRGYMRVVWKCAPYEMTVGTFVGFNLMRSWFFFRRGMRMVKRFYRGLVTWWVLVPFLPIAWLAYKWVSSVFPGPEANVPIEMLGIVLGSCILLSMKDFADSERRRHQMLEKQLRICNNYRWKLDNGLEKVQEILNLLTPTQEASSTHAGDLDSLSDEFLARLNSYANALEKLQDELGRSELADFSSSRFGRNVDQISGDILLARDCISGHDYNRLSSALNSMSYENKAIIDNLRTPWNYDNDKAHEKLIDNLLAREAVKA